jgi:hypothetical protein
MLKEFVTRKRKADLDMGCGNVKGMITFEIIGWCADSDI